jgi:hypothetical protein
MMKFRDQAYISEEDFLSQHTDIRKNVNIWETTLSYGDLDDRYEHMTGIVFTNHAQEMYTPVLIERIVKPLNFGEYIIGSYEYYINGEKAIGLTFWNHYELTRNTKLGQAL